MNDATSRDPLLTVRIKTISWETEQIRSLELRAVDGRALPPFTAGAHIDLHLPNGMMRSYSLMNSPQERHRYLIGVLHTNPSRGGSRCVHEELQLGDTIRIGAPRNAFPLNEQAPHSVLIAGGIGVTPLMSMVKRLSQLQRSWQLYYCARSRAHAAFVQELESHGERVEFAFDDERGGDVLDLASIVAAAPDGSDFYCCGPAGMLATFLSATAALPPQRRHIEYFAPPPAEPTTQTGFSVELARAGKTVNVASGQTILSALRDAGIDVPYSCEQGLCGTCETRVIAGVPDHRDAILDDAQRASNTTMMICCSGSRSDRLVLDL
jgi:vanillate O-demethylase ferredoxin subunit